MVVSETVATLVFVSCVRGRGKVTVHLHETVFILSQINQQCVCVSVCVSVFFVVCNRLCD